MSSIAPIRRGRGRGGFVRGRGRGRGRGRSIRSTHRSRTSKPSTSTLSTTPPSKSFADIVKASITTSSSSTDTVIHTWSSVRSLILSDAVVQLHVDACQALPDIYKEHLQHILDRNIYTGMSATVRARIFATLLHCKERDMCHTLLQHPNFLGLAEVVRAVQLLDANRVIRALQARYTRLEFSKINPVKPSTLTNIKTKITNAQQETVRGGSISGARQKILKRWTRSIPANKLIFYLLTFPPDLWKQLADIAHLSPADFQLPYFLPVVFGAKPPHDSVVAQAQAVTYDNFADTLKNVPELTECYSYFRQKFKDGRAARTAYETSIKELTDMGFTEHQAMLARKLAPGGTRDTQSCVDWILERQDALDGMRVDYVHKEDIPSEAKALFGRYGPLEEILWYYEELACPSVEEAIYQRLLAGEQLNIHSPRANYGKLMERLLLCMDRGVKFAPLLLSYAEARLKSLTIPTTNTTVAVMGDASGSMEIAIRCASSLGSLLSATLSADLVFFNDVCFNPSVVPRTAAEALQVIQETHAGNGTSMAAALNRFYAEQIRVDLFVLVSDEEENVDCNGMNFTTMFQQYLATVNPQAKLILVSFIPPGAPGYIGKQLQDVGIEYIEFRLDKQRPDTTKFDQLLGLLSLETSAIAYRRQVIQQALNMLPTPVQEIVQHY